MSDERLSDLDRLCAAVEALGFHATGRGWRVKGDAIWSVHHFDPANPNNLRDEYDLLEDPPEAVCRLLVEARTALPALVAEVRRLREAAELFLWEFEDLDEMFAEPSRQARAAKVIAAMRRALGEDHTHPGGGPPAAGR